MALPDFYRNQGDSASGFSNGLMAGYEFVDRIQQRRIENAERQRQNARQDVQDKRATTVFEMSLADHARNLQTKNDEELAHLTGAILLSAGGADKVNPEQRNQLLTAARASNAALKDAPDDQVWSYVESNGLKHDDRITQQNVQDRQLLEKTGAYETMLNEMNDRTAQIGAGTPAVAPARGLVATGPRSSAPPPAAPVAAAPAAAPLPANLQTTVPRSNSVLTGMFGRSTPSVPLGKPIPREIEVANENPDGPVLSRPASEAETVDLVTKSPSDYANSWVQKRTSIKDATLRNQADAAVQRHLGQELTNQQAAYEAAAPNSRERAVAGVRLQRANEGLSKLSQTRVNEVAKAATANGPAVGPAALAAVVNAAEASKTGAPSIITLEKVKAMTQQANAAATNKSRRLSEVQVKNMAGLLAHGMITTQQAENKVRYGTFDKPESPTIHNFNNGYGAIIRGDAVTYVKLPGGAPGGDKDGGGEKLGKLWATEYDRGFTNVRTALADSLGLDIKDDAQEIGEHLNRLVGAMATDPLTQVSFTDPQGRIRYDQIGAEQATALAEAYKNWEDEETSWLPWKGRGEPYSTYLMERVGAPAPTQGGGGATVVVDY